MLPSMKVVARKCITTSLSLKGTHQRIQLFFGSMVDLAVQVSMVSSMSMVSNIIYLDSLVGVEFSYSENQSDYVTGDLKTASDTHSFVLKWFEMYSDFLKKPFYISGESYAGIYVPTLSHEVAKGIDAGVKPTINFKGYMVGNSVTDEEIDGNALVPFQHGMGLISDELYEEVTVACHGNFYKLVSKNCKETLAKIDRDVSDLNVYDILEPCYHSEDPSGITTDNSKLPMSFHNLDQEFEVERT